MDKERQIDLSGQFKFVGYNRRIFAKLIDGLIFLPFSLTTNYLIKPYLGPIYSSSIISVVLAISWIFFDVKLGGTPGKLILGTRIVNKNGTFMSLSSAILRQTFILISIVYAFLIRYHVFAGLDPSDYPQTLRETSQMLKAYGGIYNIINIIFTCISLIDVGIILLPSNNKNRAVHDYLAGSFVITKQSYLKLHEKTTIEEATETLNS